MDKLTAKQAAFVAEYLVDLNATQAAIRAGYSKKSAGQQGDENLKKPQIQAALQVAMKKRQERTEITQDRVLQELARIAFFDIRKLYKDDGSLKAPNELDDESAAVLSSVESIESKSTDSESNVFDATKKVKIHDKGTALTLAMRHLGLLNDKLQIDATVKGSVSYRANLPPRA